MALNDIHDEETYIDIVIISPESDYQTDEDEDDIQGVALDVPGTFQMFSQDDIKKSSVEGPGKTKVAVQEPKWVDKLIVLQWMKNMNI